MHKKGQRIDEIFEIGVSGTPRAGLLRDIRERLSKYKRPGTFYKKFFIITPNPEIILLGQADKEYKSILKNASYSIPDAVGVVQAIKFLGLKAPKSKMARIIVCFFQGMLVGLSTFVAKSWLYNPIAPIKGREFFVDLVRLANKKKWTVVLFGGVDGEAEKTKKIFLASYKGLKITAIDGPMLDNKGKPASKKDIQIEEDAIKEINKQKPHLLFLAFTPPKQEKWYVRNQKRLRIGAAMMVGGTYRYIIGKSKLPPKWLSQMGLEWVWRLITEPHRIKRIFTAFPIFPLKVYWYKVKNL